MTDWRTPMPVADWPEDLRTAWTMATRNGDILEPNGRASRWRSDSRTMVEIGIGLWLSWLSKRESPGSILAINCITPNLIKAFALDLKGNGNSDITVAIRLEALQLMLWAIKHKGDWSWLADIGQQIRRQAKTVRKKLGRMKSTAELAALGVSLMAEGERLLDHPTRTGPVLFRDGLAIKLLALRPFRSKNFGNIHIGRHLIRENREYRLRFSAEETKTKRAIDVPLPLTLESPLERYLEIFRPRLLMPGKESARLWVVDEGGMQQAIAKRTRSAFGQSINVHLFRDIAATSLSLIDPEYVWMASLLLGHSRLDTTTRFYVQARTREATDIVNDDLLSVSGRSGTCTKRTSSNYATKWRTRKC